MAKSGFFLVWGSFLWGRGKGRGLTGVDGLLDPVHEPGDSRVDAGLHGVGASQTPRGHALQHKPVLAVAHQGAAAVALQGAQ